MSQTNDIRCGCPHGKGYCPQHSKIKMSVMLKEEYKGSYPNTVFYSFFKDEKKPTLSIINKMLERLKIRFNKAYNCIDFYDTTTNKLIHREI